MQQVQEHRKKFVVQFVEAHHSLTVVLILVSRVSAAEREHNMKALLALREPHRKASEQTGLQVFDCRHLHPRCRL